MTGDDTGGYKIPTMMVTVLCRQCQITLITMSRGSDWKNDRNFDLCTKCILKDMEKEERHDE